MDTMDGHLAVQESAEIELILDQNTSSNNQQMTHDPTQPASNLDNDTNSVHETRTDSEVNQSEDLSVVTPEPFMANASSSKVASDLSPQLASSMEKCPPHKPPGLQRKRTLRLSRQQREAVARRAKNASKQFIMFLISHVGLSCVVVAYAIMGGFIFQTLEASNEKESIIHTMQIRKSHVEKLWNWTQELNIFDPELWQAEADQMLSEFQQDIYKAVKDHGWDGSDNITAQSTSDNLQWSFAGSLLYSVTVITTIGYGNLTAKTVWGRVVTMLYALIGIPMTLLCLTNIGSFMAHCFRILWKQIVCKPCRNQIRRRSMYLAARQKASAAAYVGNLAKQKSVAHAAEMQHTVGGRDAHSGQSDEGASDSPAAVHDSTSLLGKSGFNSCPLLSGDSRYILGFEGLTKGESVSSELHDQNVQPCADDKGKKSAGYHPPLPASKSEIFQYPAQPDCGDGEAVGMQHPKITITDTVNESTRIFQTPEQIKLKKGLSQSDTVRVPIMVCLILVTAYLVLGAVLFSWWEEWNYFESYYFCFITLSTIGFGDLVPGFNHDAWGNEAKRVSCTLYLLFGLALLAMCFELIQYECRQKFFTLARTLGFAPENEQG